MNSRKCPDCAVEVGEPHRDGCDVEICTSCGVQRLMCDCPDHDKSKARWGNLKDLLADFWVDNYCGTVTNIKTGKPMEDHHCVLCSSGPGRMNTGVIDTPAAGRVWCVCPNGRARANQLGTTGP